MDRLKAEVYWTHCEATPNKKNKAPATGLGKGKPLSYEIARQNAKNLIAGSPWYGIVFPPNGNGYVGIDIDVDPTGKKANTTKEIPASVKFFLAENPTHAHYSPSGHGVHLIYRATPECAKKLDEIALTQCATKPGDLFSGDIRYKSCFLTITDKLFSSTDKISDISFETLAKLVPSLAGNAGPVTENSLTQGSSVTLAKFSGLSKIVSIEKVKDIFEVIPPTINAKIREACSALRFLNVETNYDYWVLVGQACAHQSIMLSMIDSDDTETVYQCFLNWSKKDKAGFVSEDDVQDKFNKLLASTKSKMLKLDKSIVSMKTLIHIAKYCQFNFPDLLERGSKGNKVFVPDVQSLRNVKALMDYEELELYFDSMGGGYCFKGPEETVTRWFCANEYYKSFRPEGFSQVYPYKPLVPVLQAFLQNRYKTSISQKNTAQLLDYLISMAKDENAFKRWIKSKPWDGVERFHSVIESLKTSDDRPHYKDLIRMALYSLVGIHFFEQEEPKINLMLVLAGTQHTRKSTWVDFLIPKELENYRAEAPASLVKSGSDDWRRLLVTKAVVRVDECEELFNPLHINKLKESIDTHTATFRDLWDSYMRSRLRTALIIGTTNKLDLFTPATGSRKFGYIPVDMCDSEALKQMDRQQLYAEILFHLQEYKKKHPKRPIQKAWSLNDHIIELIEQTNRDFKDCERGVSQHLCQLFGYAEPKSINWSDYLSSIGWFTGDIGQADMYSFYIAETQAMPRLWTQSELAKLVNLVGNAKHTVAEVKYALEEYCGVYTGTLHKAKTPFTKLASKEFTKNLRVFKGYVTRKRQKFFLLPPLVKATDVELHIELRG